MDDDLLLPVPASGPASPTPASPATPADAAATSDASDEFARLLWRFDGLYQAYDGIFRDKASRLGLSDTAFLVMYALYVYGDGCRQKDVYTFTCSSRQTVNSAVHKLVRTGLLDLEPRGRDTLLHATPLGARMLAEQVGPLVQAESQAFACMAPAERETLLELLDRYVREVGRLSARSGEA